MRLKKLVVIGTEDAGLAGIGKVHPPIFFPNFSAALSRLDVTVETYETVQDFKATAPQEEAVVLLIYNEERLTVPAVMSEALLAHRLAQEKFSNVLVIHPPEQGLVISNKITTLERLGGTGCDVPKRILAGRSAKTFSHEFYGSGHKAVLSDIAEAGKHNVQFIDTRQTVADRDYFICLRAMAVGAECISCFVRAKDAQAGDPVVHNSDTPKDPLMLNELHERLVRPNWRAFVEICRKVEAAIGFGMFAIDILPCRATGNFYVCEVNIKLEEFGMRSILNLVRPQLTYGAECDQHYPERAAHALFQGVRRKGFWW